MTIYGAIAVGIFLLIAAFQDIKSKQISLRLCLVFMTLGIVTNIVSCACGNVGVWQVVFSILPGVGMMLVSCVTKQGIGIGDGVVMLIMGLFLGQEKIIVTLLMGLLFSTIVSIYLLLIKKVDRKYELPFIPFLLVASIVVFLGGIG